MERMTPNFESMNETAVREELLSPFLRQLGYMHGTDNSISYETTLVYPRIFLGRKGTKDPYLRGRADYILEVKDYARWVLEAKASYETIGQDAIEQAYSYAIHPEVRASYFAISNGKRLVVYRTSQPPDTSPLLDLAFEDFSRAHTVLSASAIRSEFQSCGPIGDPIANGFGSIAKIAQGWIRYDQINPPNSLISETQVSIVDGSIERGENGGLIASISTQGPFRSIQSAIEKLGLGKLAYVSFEKRISPNPESPTIFTYEGTTTFEEGTMLFDSNSSTSIPLPFSISIKVNSVVSAYIEEKTIYASIKNKGVTGAPLHQEFDFSGSIQMKIV